MSYSFDGANDRIIGSFTSTYAGPITLASYIKITAHPVAVDIFVNLGNGSASANDAYSIATGTADDRWIARSSDSAGTTSDAFIDPLNIDGVWAGVVGTFPSDDLSRQLYVQLFSQSGTNGATRAVADVLQFISLGEELDQTNDFAGLLAEVAIWNAILSHAQIEAYMAGNAASGIAAANLIGYWPLSVSNATQSNEGIDTGGDLTVTGAIFDADHPTITSAAAPSLFVVRSGLRLN